MYLYFFLVYISVYFNFNGIIVILVQFSERLNAVEVPWTARRSNQSILKESESESEVT